MTYHDIHELIAEIAEKIGCDYHYYDEEERKMIKAPYLLFDFPNRDDMHADDHNYVHIQQLNIEYDSRNKEIDSENLIESILDANDLSYRKEDQRLDEQNVYEIMYSMEVMING